MTTPPKTTEPHTTAFAIDGAMLSKEDTAHNFLKRNYPFEFKLGIVLGVIFDASILYWLIGEWKIGQLNDFNAFFLLILPLIAYGAALVWAAKQVRHEFYRRFAFLNGYSYQKTGWLENRKGALFKIGHSKKMEDIIKGQIGNLPFALFNYTYTVGYGKHSRTFTQTVWDIDFQTALPPILLLNDRQNFGDDITDNNLKYVSKIYIGDELEKHFNLFSEKKFEMEALQIFNAEFLRDIYQNYKGFNLDFTSNSLFVFSNRIFTSEPELKQLKNFVDLLSQKLSVQLPNMQGAVLSLHEALSKASPPNVFIKTGGQLFRNFQSAEYKYVWLIILFFFLFMLIIELF